MRLLKTPQEGRSTPAVDLGTEDRDFWRRSLEETFSRGWRYGFITGMLAYALLETIF